MNKLKSFVKKHYILILVVVVFVVVFWSTFGIIRKEYKDSLSYYCQDSLHSLSDYVNHCMKESDLPMDYEKIVADYLMILSKGSIFIFYNDSDDNKVISEPKLFQLVYASDTELASQTSNLHEFMKLYVADNVRGVINAKADYTSDMVKVNGNEMYLSFYHPTPASDYMYVCMFDRNQVYDYFQSLRIQLTILGLLISGFFCATIMFQLRVTKKNKAQVENLTEIIHQNDIRYELLSDLTNEFMFEYDFAKDTLSFSQKYQEIFHRGRIFVPFRASLSTHYTIYHKDISLIEQELQRILEEKAKNGELVFRLQMRNSEYEWFRIVYQVSYNSRDGKPSVAVGKMYNIHQEKMEKDLLISKSSTDVLTQLLNRDASQKEIKQYMENEMLAGKKCALLIMDVDHFKNINDTFGHSRGDDLLVRIAGIIKNTFRSNDIICRLGGDEFMIFMKNLTQEGNAIKKCEELCHEMRLNITYDDVTVKISTSIGLYFVNVGDTFEDIYMKADSALYNAKEAGRDRFCIFSPMTHKCNTFNKKKS